MEPPIGTSYTRKSPPAASKLPLSQQNLQQKQKTEAKVTAIAQRRQILLPPDRCSSHDRKFWESRAQFGARQQQQQRKEDGDGENDGSSIFFSTRLERRNARHHPNQQQQAADGIQQKPEFLHNEIEDNFWEDLAISRGNMLRRVSCVVDTGMTGNGAAGGRTNREEGMLREVVRKLRESVGNTARRTAYGFRLPSRDQKAATAVPKVSRARSSGPTVEKDGQNNGGEQSTKKIEGKCREEAEEQHGIWSKLAAEFCGDLFLVFIGSLSALGSNDTTARLHAGLATGLTIFLLVASIGQISGGHFNPAVSWAMALSGKMPFHQMLAYWAAQLSGGTVGALLVWAVTHTSQYAEIGGGAQFLKAQQQWPQALVVEALLTALLVQTVLNSAAETPNNPLAPLAIGCTILVDILAGGPISGASINPARAFGPCLVAFWLLPLPSAANSSSAISSVDIRAQIWPGHFIFWAGPLIGASVAAMAYRQLFTRQRYCKI